MSKKITALTELTVQAAGDLLHLVDFDVTENKSISVTNLFAGIPVDLDTDGHVYQNEPFSYAGKRIEIVSPYTTKDNEYQGQLHFHSDESDGADTPTDIVTAYKDAGYDFVSLTDHDLRTADPSVAGILFIHGVEETASNNPLGHIINTGATAQSALTGPQPIIDAILADGAIPIIAHPNDVGAASDFTDADFELVDNFIAIEVYNQTVTPNSNAEDKWDVLLSKHIRAFGTAVDDCHDMGGATFDKGWVQVFADTLTEANILDSLKRGNFYATTGPDLAVSVSKKVVTAATSDAGTIAFIGDGGATLQTTAAATTASYTIVGNEIYVRIKVTRDSDSETAWSNPIYVYQLPTSMVQNGAIVKGNAYHNGNIIFRDGKYIGQVSGPRITFDDTLNQLEMTGCSVGIGTTGPSALLAVEATVNGFTLDSWIEIYNPRDTADSTYTGINFRTRAASEGKGWFGFSQTLGNGRGDFVFLLDAAADDNDVATTDEVMRIKNNGRVGIGTSGPSALLAVEATINGFTPDSWIEIYNPRDTADSTYAGINFRARAANEGKGWFGFDQTLGNGRGDFIFLLDATADDNDVAIADLKMRLTNAGTLKIAETAAAVADTAGFGQLWIKNADPCELWFTDDAGLDTQIV